MLKKFVQFAVLLLLCTSCKPDFSVWKDMNTSHFETIGRTETLKSTPSGVLYRVVDSVWHTGYVPKPESQVLVSYTGWLADGTQFEKAERVAFYVSDVIAGWQEALCMMTDGEKWILYVPAELGYGEQGLKNVDGTFAVPPHSMLKFELHLIEVANF